jgi:N-glycosylase/DNA lyase
MKIHLRRTLSCGQTFRWFERAGWFYVHHAGRLFRARPPFEVEGIPLAEAKRFFALDHDLDRIESTFPKDAPLRRAVDAFRGIRILRQDPYETLLAFILSACSNIPRISRDLDSLARRFGKPIRCDGVESHGLPRPETRLPAGPLRRLGTGFRAPYLSAAQRRADPTFLERIRRLATPEAREALCELPGVGVKVADCVLLFAYERLEVFPIDTRIRKLMIREYFAGRRTPDRDIAALARDRFGPFAGYAQQFLYAWSRRR